jgi:hypothetical protein
LLQSLRFGVRAFPGLESEILRQAQDRLWGTRAFCVIGEKATTKATATATAETRATADPSTTHPAMKLRDASLRMTIRKIIAQDGLWGTRAFRELADEAREIFPGLIGVAC